MTRQLAISSSTTFPELTAGSSEARDTEKEASMATYRSPGQHLEVMCAVLQLNTRGVGRGRGVAVGRVEVLG